MKFIIFIMLFILALIIGSAFLFSILPMDIYKDEDESVYFERLIEDGFTTFKNKKP